MAKRKSTGGFNVSKFILNCLPSRDRERDWPMEGISAAAGLTAPPIPSSKDLRKAWWTIGNQGSTGSCVGWAAADSVFRWHFVQAGKLTTAQRVSVRQVWMSAKETDLILSPPTTFIEKAGTTLKAALDIGRNRGVVLESILPFASGSLYPGDVDDFYTLAAERRIASYGTLGSNLSAWRRCIALSGPILTRLGVDQTWDRASSTGGNLDTYLPSTIRGGHAVALVGYTPDRFIVRNSWGTSWGDAGFGYASNSYAIAAFTEAYGVVA